MKNDQYYVYILTTRNNTALYVGVTSNLVLRIAQHKQGRIPGFTKTYHIHKLVLYEMHHDSSSAIEREKQIKRWRREKKIKLIAIHNPEWRDLINEL